MIADASCAPADIRYPTDTSLLSEAREKTDALIDRLHEPLVGKEPRPRTYRVKARRQFLALVKQKKPGRPKIRRANRRPTRRFATMSKASLARACDDWVWGE